MKRFYSTALKLDTNPYCRSIIGVRRVNMTSEDNHKKIKAALEGVVRAWEALPEGYNSVYTTAEWMNEVLHPAINKAREALGRPALKSEGNPPYVKGGSHRFR